jgi:hypothetical protein
MNSIRPTNRFSENCKLLVAFVFFTPPPPAPQTPPAYHIWCVDMGRKKNEGTAVRRGSQAGPDQPAFIRRWARAFPFLADRILYRSRSTVTSWNRIDVFSFITITNRRDARLNIICASHLLVIKPSALQVLFSLHPSAVHVCSKNTCTGVGGGGSHGTGLYVQ